MKRISFFSWSLMLAVLVSGLVVTGCESDDEEKPTLTPSELSLYVDESATLTYKGDGKCTWTSTEPLIASVTQNGVVTGKLVGNTTIKANDLTCKVEVKPQYNTYYEPCMEWGCAQSVVKNHMNGYVLNDADSESLSYKGKGKAILYLYTFENNMLEMSGLAISSSYTSEITSFLSERYIPVLLDEDSYSFMFTDVKKNTLVVLQIYSASTLLIAYTRYPNSDTRTIYTESDLLKNIYDMEMSTIEVDTTNMDKIAKTIKSQIK